MSAILIISKEFMVSNLSAALMLDFQHLTIWESMVVDEMDGKNQSIFDF